MTTGSAAAPTNDPRVAAALARNDAYLHDFVEAHNLCPWARYCRETGHLHRRVVLVAGGLQATPAWSAAVAAADAAVLEAESAPPASLEVGLLIFPALDEALSTGAAAAERWTAFCGAVRAATEARHGKREPPFFCVPFHPDFPEDLATPARAVRFMRRSPDPTLQLVRRSLLREIRGRTPDTLVVDPTKLSDAELQALQVPESVSDRIARVDLETVKSLGVEEARLILDAARRLGRGTSIELVVPVDSGPVGPVDLAASGGEPSEGPVPLGHLQ